MFDLEGLIDGPFYSFLISNFVHYFIIKTTILTFLFYVSQIKIELKNNNKE